MPCPIFEIEETYVNILRPAVLKICSDILHVTKAPAETKITLRGYGSQDKTTFTSLDGGDRQVGFNQRPRLDVTAEIEYPDDTFFTGQTVTGEQSIVRDVVNAIDVEPVFIEREFNLSLKYMNPSRVDVDRWRDRIRRNVGLGMRSLTHEIEYHYPLPQQLVSSLHTLYGLTDTTGTFSDWLKGHATEALSTLVNRAGGGETLAINQRQVGVVGYWNFEKVPEVSHVENGDNYETTFTYKFRIKQPTALRMVYPLIINNTMVPNDLRPQCDYNQTTLLSKKNMLQWGTDSLLNRTRTDQYPSVPVTVPCFDDWLPEQEPFGTAAILNALTVVDSDDPTAVVPVTTIGTRFEYSDWMLELIELFKNDVTTMGSSPVLFSVYQNDIWLAGEQIFVDESKYLRTKDPLRTDCRYHVRVGLYTDLTLLSERTHGTLMRHGKLTQKLFATLGRDVIEKYGWEIIPTVSSNGSIAKLHYWKFIHLLRNTTVNYKNNIEVNRLTVGTCIVTTRRS